MTLEQLEKEIEELINEAALTGDDESEGYMDRLCAKQAEIAYRRVLSLLKQEGK